MRFLEISHLSYIKEAFPDETERIDTNFALLPGQGIFAKLKAVGAQFRRLWVASFRERPELVFCRCFGRFIYRRNLSLPINGLRLVMGWLVMWCVWMQTRRGARLVVIDQLDESTIDQRDLFLLRRCSHYFKRELPQNTWNVFLRVQPRHGEFHDLTRHPGFLPHLHKFAPVSLGITDEKIRRIQTITDSLRDAAKDIDVFYAGPTSHSTVRTAGLAAMDELRRRGYRVEVHEQPLPFDEFVSRMRRSWLVWSPEGQGWDCYRHYEASVAGTVALINQPGIRRHEPLLPGVHCVEYHIEGDDFCQQVERALADRDSLRRMAAAARDHVLIFHTHAQLGRSMVRRVSGVETVGMETTGG